MVLAPTSEQSKFVLLNVLLAIEQLSVDPLSISPTVTEPAPLASKLTVMFWVSTVGLIVSCTVTTALAESMLPFKSVTIR